MSKFDRRVIPLCALTLLAVPHPAVVVHSVDGAAAAVAEQIDIDAGHRAPMARKASRCLDHCMLSPCFLIVMRGLDPRIPFRDAVPF